MSGFRYVLEIAGGSPADPVTFTASEDGTISTASKTLQASALGQPLDGKT